MNSAVLLIVFNRPVPTRAVFEALREARPPRLYVAADGPRAAKAGDKENCRAVRQIVQSVDWPCEVVTLFRDENLGCKYAVSGAISWFFEQESEGIILEDDCLPEASFFPYCDEMLERFRDDERIAQICGSSFIPPPAPDKSYYFTKYADIWGWATWRRSWAHYDLAMRQWPNLRETNSLKGLPGSTMAFVNYWTDIFDQTHAGKVDTWDYQWMFTCWRLGLLSVMPCQTQIRNVGFGLDATHTGVDVPPYVRATEALTFPLRHNEDMTLRPAVEQNIARERYFIRGVSEGMVRVRRIPVFGSLSIDFARWARSVVRSVT